MRKTLVAFLLSTSLLAACANQQTHELYTGPQADAITLQANDTIIVTHIDASEQETAFIGQKHTYRLAPGKHVLLVEYAAFFQLDADRHEKIKSPPIKVTFEAQPGKSYLFRHAEQSTVEAAKAFAKAPKIELIMLPEQTPVNATFEQSLPMSFLPQVRFGNTESYGFASDRLEQSQGTATASMSVPGAFEAAPSAPAATGAAVPGSGTETVAPPVLDSLKALWQKTSPDQRDAFLQWVKTQ